MLLHGRDAAKGEPRWARSARSTGNERRAFYSSTSARSRRCEAGGADPRRAQRGSTSSSTTRGSGPEAAPSERVASQDGYELRFAIMYPPHLLTQLLEPLLARSAPARIVNVASAGQSAIDFDDVMLERGYSGVQAYCPAKTALVMLRSNSPTSCAIGE